MVRNAISQKTNMGLLTIAIFLLLTPAALAKPPIITHHPLDMSVVRNEPVTLDCRAKGNPSPTIQWFRNGEPVHTTMSDPASHRMMLPDGALFFLKAVQSKKEQDAGVYWCVASNPEGVARSRNATLSVSYLRDDFRMAPMDMDALLGSPALLRCSPPKGSPVPVVKWIKDGETLDLSSGKRVVIDAEGNLNINRLVKDDNGRYQCSAENLASSRISKPVRLRVLEAPSFLTKPKSQSVIGGTNLLLQCQATGDPHPDIVWTRSPDPLNNDRVKIVPGKGLRIENVAASDAGSYTCRAKNGAGSVIARADVRVLERPRFTVTPPPVLELKAGQKRARLDCLAVGVPAPKLFWVREGHNEDLLRPGMKKGSLRVNLDGSLMIEGPTKPANSGYYTCFAVNTVGSTVARTKLIFSDDDEEENFDFEIEEARLASLEKGLSMKTVTPLSPTTLKVSWSSLPTARRYIQGYNVWYRASPSSASEGRTSEWDAVQVDRPEISSLVLERLEENTKYEAFVQPFFRGVIGRPSEVGSASTEAGSPSAAPSISVARALNDTSVFIAWRTPSAVHDNGEIKVFEISILENDGSTSFNQSVSASASEATLYFHGLEPSKTYSVRIAAANAAGIGPFSAPLEMTVLPAEVNTTVSSLTPDMAAAIPQQLIWVIVSAAVFVFMLLLLLGVCFYHKKVGFGVAGGKTVGYLEASTEEFHHCGINRSLQKAESAQMQMSHQQGSNIWLDRRWNTADFGGQEADKQEKQSNGSEKKLLHAQSHHLGGTGSNSNSDTEYTYVDRHVHHQHRQNVSHNGSSGSRHNTSFTASSGSGGSGAGSADRRQAKSPEPYATTEIFRQQSLDTANQERIYAAPVMNYKRAGGNKSSALICDDLSKRSTLSNNYSSQRPNLLDMIPPPPPGHPPPPPTYVSQESVISPKYLFSHPVYQAQTSHYHRVYPQPQQQLPVPRATNNRYEEILPSSSSADSEADAFSRLLPPSHAPQPRALGQHERQRSIEEFERDLASELQIFNEAITKFSERKRRSHLNKEGLYQHHKEDGGVEGAEEMMISACEADREDN